MTMQIALSATERKVVFASDTKVRRTEQELTDKTDLPFGIVHHSKIRFSKRHDIAVGLSGWDANESDLGQQLAEHLDAQQALPDTLVDVFTGWGNEVFRSRFPNQKHDFPLCKLLIVNPRSVYSQFLKLRVRRDSDFLEGSEYLLNGSENSSAIFWPEYFKCDKEHYDLEATIRIAAFTILMGSEINGYGIGGLEIWQYDGEWNQVPRNGIERLKADFIELQGSIRAAVLR